MAVIKKVVKGCHLVRLTPKFVLLTSFIVFCINVLVLWSYTMDDSYIFYRYASNLYHYGQIAFNLNEPQPAEGITSPLWMILLSLSHVVGIEVLVYSKILGIVFSLGTALLLYSLTKYHAKRLLSWSDEHSKVIGALSFSVLITDPYFSGNAVSGMETSLSGFIVLYFYKVTALENCEKYLFYTPVIGVLACLSRPEAIVIVIIVYTIAYSDKKNLLYLKQLFLFLLLGLVYFNIRYSYYETTFPLPFYIKQSFLSGVGYTLKFLLYWKIVVLVLIIGWVCFNIRKHKTELMIPYLLIFGFVLYWLTPEHLMGFGYRYFQPIVAFIILLSITIVAIIFNNLKALLSHSSISKLILVIGCFTLFGLSMIASETKTAYNIYLDYSSGMNILEGVGKSFSKIDSATHRSIAMTDCGAVPYFSKWRVLDLGGLNNRVIALDYTPQTIMKVLANELPDVVIMVSKNIDRFNPVFEHEKEFEKNYLSVGYTLMCALDIYSNYKYFLYARDTDFGSDIIKVLEENKVRVHRYFLPSLESKNQS